MSKFVCTDNHKLFVHGKWAEAKDLRNHPLQVYAWYNVDTWQLFPTFFVRRKPYGCGVGWLKWAVELRWVGNI